MLNPDFNDHVIQAEFRSALNIKTALDRIHLLPRLGYCPTKVQAFRDRFGLNDKNGVDSKYYKDKMEVRFRTRDIANQV